MAQAKYSYYPWRPVLFALGGVAGAVSAYGAYKYALQMGPGASYLVIAAPITALGAVIIPPAMKSLWRQGEPLIALAMFPALLLCAAFAFYAVAERTHLERIGAEKAREARVFAGMRAEEALRNAKAKLTPAIERDEAGAKANRNCENIRSCQTALAFAQQIRKEISEAESNLVKAQAEALSESNYKAPTWLLGAAVDALAFVFVWAGLSGPWWRRRSEEEEEIVVAGFTGWLRSLRKTEKDDSATKLKAVTA